MNNISSPLAALMQSDVNENTDSPKSLLDLINSHKPPEETDAPKSLLDLINLHNQPKDVDAANSLSDLINSHNSSGIADSPKSLSCLMNSQNSSSQSCVDNEIKSVHDPTFGGANKCPTVAEKISSLPSSLNKLMIVDNSADKGCENCDTLEAYTKSFLNSKGCNVLPFRKPRPPPGFRVTAPNAGSDDANLQQIRDKLENIRVDEPNKVEIRELDLTAALQSRCKTNSASSSSSEIPVKTKRSVFAYPVQHCDIDLSFIAEKNLFYSDTSLSPLGYVIAKKWNRIILPKKYRKLDKIRPYNIAKSFKFDTPYPDQCTTGNRIRNVSASDT